MVEVSKPQEALRMPDTPWRFPIQDRVNLRRVHLNATSRDYEPQEGCFLNVKLALFRLNK